MSSTRTDGLSVPGEDPGTPRPASDQFRFGIFSMFMTTFTGMVGQGYSPSEALAVTIVVCVGAAEIIRRLPGDGDDHQGRPRWA